MKFRTGLIIGAAVGYYYGTKAGHERYVQLERILDRVRASPPYQLVRRRVGDVVELGRGRALGAVDHLIDETSKSPSATDNTEDLDRPVVADPRPN